MIYKFIGCTLPVASYTVNNKTYFEYKYADVARYSTHGFLTTTKKPVAFDTINQTVTLSGDFRLQGEKQIILVDSEPVTLNWDMSGGATNYVYLKSGTELVCSVTPPGGDDIYLFAFFRARSYLESFNGCTLPINLYTVNNNSFEKEDVISFNANRIEPLLITAPTKIYGNGYELNLGTPLTGERVDNVVTVNYTPKTDSHFYKTFVTKTEGLLVESSRPYYNVTIWAFNGNKYDAIRLVPYLTLAEVMANDNSFTYSDGVITINSANYTDFVLAGEDGYGIAVTANVNVEIHDLKILFARENCCVVKKGHVTLKNCELGFCTSGNGLSVQNADCDTIACKAYYNRNDGFNYHYSGHSTVIECEGYNNFDDGISHHEQCTFEINGGLWLNNGKGGIASPTYGSKGRISNAICIGNSYGVYAESTEEETGDIYINSMLIKDNEVGVHSANYNVTLINSTLSDNDTDTSALGSGKVTVL